MPEDQLSTPPQTPPGSSSFSSQRFLQVAPVLATILVTIGILGYMLYSQRQVLQEYQWNVNFGPVILSIVLFSLGMFISAFIWAWMMNSVARPLPIWTHIRTYILSLVARRIPGFIWYIASRVQIYRAEGIDMKVTSLASGMEFTIMVISGILVSLVFALRIAISYHVSPWVLVVSGVLGLGVLHPKVLTLIFRLLKVEGSVFRYKDIINWILAYIAVWLLAGVILYANCNIITPVPISQLGYLIGSWALTGVITSSLFFLPSNFGVTEIGLSLLLSKIMPLPVAVIVAVMTRLLLTFYEIVWAGIFLALKISPKSH